MLGPWQELWPHMYTTEGVVWVKRIAFSFVFVDGEKSGMVERQAKKIPGWFVATVSFGSHKGRELQKIGLLTVLLKVTVIQLCVTDLFG